MARLAGKVAIVAGAGSIAEGWGNGKATSVLFAREGAKVLAVDRDLEAARQTEAIIRGEGGECTAHRADVSIAAEVDAMVEDCLAAYGRIDVLFNNVGIQVVGGPLDISEEEFEKLMAVNVKAMYLTCRAVIPVMLRQGGGAIVNNASTAAIRYTYPNVGYAASKGAVRQLTQNIGVQYASQGIRCNAVLPGFIATPRITARLQRSNPDDWEEKLKERLDARTLIDVVNASTGRNSATEDKFPQSILPRSFDYGGKLSTMYKDVRLCLEEAQRLGVPMWVGSTVTELWFHAMCQGRGDDDYTSIAKMIEAWSDVVIGDADEA